MKAVYLPKKILNCNIVEEVLPGQTDTPSPWQPSRLGFFQPLLPEMLQKERYGSDFPEFIQKVINI
jgi:hypothetical protein